MLAAGSQHESNINNHSNMDEDNDSVYFEQQEHEQVTVIFQTLLQTNILSLHYLCFCNKGDCK